MAYHAEYLGQEFGDAVGRFYDECIIAEIRHQRKSPSQDQPDSSTVSRPTAPRLPTDSY
jgi:hypothetical protein